MSPPVLPLGTSPSGPCVHRQEPQPKPCFSSGWGVLAWEALVFFASLLVPPPSLPEEVKTCRTSQAICSRWTHSPEIQPAVQKLIDSQLTRVPVRRADFKKSA